MSQPSPGRPSGTASLFAVGLLSANTTGYAVFSDTAFTTSSPNAARCPLSPSSTVTFASRAVSSRLGIEP